MNQIQGNAVELKSKQPSNVELALDRLDAAVTTLKESIGRLDRRLVPVMGPESPLVQPDRPHLSAVCPVDDIIITQTFRVENLDDVVTTIIDRLAI